MTAHVPIGRGRSLDKPLPLGIIPPVIGHTVRRARVRAAISQATLAKRARISQAYTSRLEAGVPGNPSIAVLKRLVKALGVPVSRLLA